MQTTKLPKEQVNKLLLALKNFSSAKDLSGIMGTTRRIARDVTGSDGVTFVLRDGDMCYYADEEAISPLWKGCRFPMSTCISGWAMKNQRTALVDDIEEDPRIPTDVYRPTFVQSLLMVPIRKKDPIGAIGNYWAEQHRPTQEEIETIQALAEIAGVAMENVRVHNELDKRVKERTSQLEAFSYSVAHDLKNPLAGMEMRLNSLEADEEASSENIQEVTEDLREAIDRMKGMIDGLLELSCLGDDGVKRSWTDMEGTVRSIAKKTKEEEGHGPIELRIGKLPMEYVDPTLFQRVWQNLLSNAIKFSSEVENPLIEIGMEEQKEERIYWIRDNGKGFRSDKAAELFKAFRKMDPEDNYPGSGIGLSMVQQIIYRHGGTIWAEGEKGKGATFFFSLPWDTDEERISTPPN